MSERLLVPGVLDLVLVDDDGRARVELGPLADVPTADLTAWDGPVWVAPRRGEPGAGLDLTDAPCVRRRLARSAWEVVDPATARLRQGAGARVLGLEPRADGAVRVTWARGDGTDVVVDVSVWDLWSRVLGPMPETDAADWERRHAECVPVEERVVQAVTGGEISLRDVDLAQWAAGLDPALLTFEEAVLAEVEARAAGQREAALGVVEASGGAAQDEAAEDEVDALGVIRAVRNPAFEVETSAGVVPVPEVRSWVAAGVVDWEPEAAQARREARFDLWRGKVKAAKAAGKRRERRVWLTIGVLLALGLAVGLLGWLASGG